MSVVQPLIGDLLVRPHSDGDPIPPGWTVGQVAAEYAEPVTMVYRMLITSPLPPVPAGAVANARDVGPSRTAWVRDRLEGVDTTVTPEVHRNRLLAGRIRDGSDTIDQGDLIEWIGKMADAHLDVPGPRARQLADALERVRVEVANWAQDPEVTAEAAMRAIEHTLFPEKTRA